MASPGARRCVAWQAWPPDPLLPAELDPFRDHSRIAGLNERPVLWGLAAYGAKGMQTASKGCKVGWRATWPCATSRISLPSFAGW